MDKRFFKVIEELHDCAALANAMAMNANYDQKYDDCMKEPLAQIMCQVHSTQQMLFRAVRLQTAGEPWCR